jgi:hypothetical protein
VAIWPAEPHSQAADRVSILENKCNELGLNFEDLANIDQWWQSLQQLKFKQMFCYTKAESTKTPLVDSQNCQREKSFDNSQKEKYLRWLIITEISKRLVAFGLTYSDVEDILTETLEEQQVDNQIREKLVKNGAELVDTLDIPRISKDLQVRVLKDIKMNQWIRQNFNTYSHLSAEEVFEVFDKDGSLKPDEFKNFKNYWNNAPKTN